MAGRLFAVVGPTGAGKHTLMAEAQKRRPDLHLVRRVITRPEEAGGEPFEGVSQQEFARRKAAGDFALDWETNGVHYGIPTSIDRAISEGRDVLFNGSRGVLGQAWEEFPGLTVILVTASVPVLADRLAALGQESRADIARRLARADYEIPYGPPIVVVENDGALDQAVTAFLSVLQPLSV
ncbi:phosphonate metabolism protein/1,5-bisphosphokinase (PRPP-forming) PhnN [Tropicimonas isoalkanivorans]|uniref:ribose 1,5-bisphosphate phosphokinase n=1 Tax=Tropicimonas isoalkanivorans TaxID=441112 RepID=A0A1I1P6A0_9RHOB|nr:phosphonate metabolism protein/1,5-bisphosphokinase (PRPP-forming) PhnN [Tropicimonas isoalkanivorans]SFD05206.1 ribose 1,5-bisphosphokinase [Tropicimonas isoalkanivorans]